MIQGKKSLCFLLLLLCASLPTFAQVKVRGGFLYDSIRIGEKTGYYLSAKYPSTSIVLFPDSTYTFSPFDFDNKSFFNSRSENGVTTDSAIYFVRSFDIVEMQRLQLPVYLLNAIDCTTYFCNPDSIKITSVTASVPDTLSIAQLPLKIDTDYKAVNKPLNLMVVFIVIGALFLMAGIVWVFFGDRISAYFTARRLQRNYAAFVHRYDKKISEVKTRFSPESTEAALFIWKRYMEELEARPYTKLTTTETRMYGDEHLSKSLKLADRAIYANDPDAASALHELKGIADARFQNRLKEVTHGK